MNRKKVAALITAPALAAGVLLPLAAGIAHADPPLDLCGGAADNYTGTFSGSYGYQQSYTTFSVALSADGTAVGGKSVGGSPTSPVTGTFTVNSLDGLLASASFSSNLATVLPIGATTATPLCDLGSNTVQRLDIANVILTRNS